MRLALSVVVMAVAVALASASVLYEEEARVPAAWTLRGPARSDAPVSLYFFVRPKGDAEAQLMRRSSPNSPLFRQWLTGDQVASRFVDATAVREVSEWLAPLKPRVRGSGNVVSVRTTAGRAAKLLDTQFGLYGNGQHRLVRATGPYRLPKEVAAHVQVVGGLRHFPNIRRTKRKKKQTRAGLAITPRIIHDRYGTGNTKNLAGNNSQSVAQFLGQHFWETDLQEFFGLYSRDNLGKKPIKVGPDSGFAGVEASLDIEYIMSVGQDVKTYFWSTPGLHDGQEPFLEWMLNVTELSSPPLVNSVSYGDDEDSLSVAYIQSVNFYFTALGLRGVSLLFAAGDDGVCGGGGSCGPEGQFVPSFPASSPVVTAVGGTSLSGPLETGSEVAWSGSGGGFSNVFAMPGYQRAAVVKYLGQNKASLPPSANYNVSGRCYPDVAAFSTGFMVVSNLVPQPVDGTSCATPTFAGVVSLLNGARLAAGKPSLGFMNPWLYAVAGPQGGLTDIVKGNNGFPCAPGYDPVTGWGSPIYAKLASL